MNEKGEIKMSIEGLKFTGNYIIGPLFAYWAQSNKEKHELKLEGLKTIQEISPKVLEWLNHNLRLDPELLKNLLNSGNERIYKFIEQLNNDKLSEEGKQEMLKMLSETNATENKRVDSITTSCEFTVLVATTTTAVYFLSNHGVNKYKEIKNVGTISYKFANGVNNILKIIK